VGKLSILRSTIAFPGFFFCDLFAVILFAVILRGA
jgi:hypothetical protein